MTLGTWQAGQIRFGLFASSQDHSSIRQSCTSSDAMQPLNQVRSRPAVVGDLTQNLTSLNQDSNDIAAEMLRIEGNAGDLYNLAAASQNALRQLIRQAIYTSNQQLFVEPFISAAGLQPGYTATLDTNAGSASLPLSKQTQLTPVFTIGVNGTGTGVNAVSLLSSTTVGTSFQWLGPELELILSFASPATVNRLQIVLDTYDGLEITSLTSSPDGMVFNDVLASLNQPTLVMDATSGKCSGDVIIDFPPVIAQQMRIVISCRSGQPGFGLRSVAAFTRAYQSAATLVTNPIYLGAPQVDFSVSQLVSSPYTSITHQISADGVNFTTVKPGVLSVSSPFWYQVALGRSNSAFNQQGSSLLPILSTAAANNPFTIVSQSTVPLANGMVEQTIVLSSVTGPVVFQDAPLAASLTIQVGSLYMAAANYTLAGSTLTFAANQSLVTITYQTSALGAAALASLKSYYSPLLFEARFQAI
jgi:hypothetical protein